MQILGLFLNLLWTLNYLQFFYFPKNVNFKPQKLIFPVIGYLKKI